MEGQELPVGWETYCLDELGGTKGGKTPSKSRPEFWEPGTINWTSPKDMKVFDLNGAEDQISDLAITEGGMEVLPAGSVLMVTRSGILSHTFPVAVANSETSINQDIKAVRPVAGLDERFLAYSLKSLERVVLQACSKEGTTVASVETKLLERLPLPLAPLNEQRRIAAKLDTTLATVDACRQRLDGLAAILKRFRQAVLAAATSGELTREWREERGDFSHWQEKGLAELGEFGRGRSRHRPRNDPRLYGGDYPFIQTGDVANAKGDWLAAHSQTYSNYGLAQSRIWPSSTLCITIAANIADTALLEYPACFPDSVVGFVADRAQVEPLLAKWMIDSVADKLESFAPATAQKNINLAILDQIVFSVPPLQEQTEIISRAQHLFTLADQLEARLTAARKVVDRLTPALLAKAFRGELVPQDPNDEPASVLLARIRAARQADAGAGKPWRRGRPKAAANPDQIAMDAAPVPLDFLAGLLRECGALSERALLAVSELEPKRFQQQLYRELESGTAREVQDNGQVLLEAVG